MQNVMQNAYTLQLERGSKKHICPQCGKKTYKRFVNVVTGEYLPEKYGRCDREEKCGYFLHPAHEKNLLPSIFQKKKTAFFVAEPERQQKTFFPVDVYADFCKIAFPPENQFLSNLQRISKKSNEEIVDVSLLYLLGTITTGKNAGDICFPFFDIAFKLHAVQVKGFDGENHTLRTNFLHSVIANDLNEKKQPLPEWLVTYKKNSSFVDCLFGEHLLAEYKDHTVCLVEAPKTAIYCTLFFGLPEKEKSGQIWLAVYNKSSFKPEKLRPLVGRRVVIFPDLSHNGSTFNEWKNKAEKFFAENNTTFYVSDYLEKKASQGLRSRGGDLADVLFCNLE